ncbi:fumarate hydratase [Cystoisospora suis]|uniref:Fumarate hydratase n=1 Tax=Cystoisospora suis TaxID=483139 RepID=A0A2C6KX10_9APIC|nr:fumarate hydratase [Cystoisospora suis]
MTVLSFLSRSFSASAFFIQNGGSARQGRIFLAERRSNTATVHRSRCLCSSSSSSFFSSRSSSSPISPLGSSIKSHSSSSSPFSTVPASLLAMSSPSSSSSTSFSLRREDSSSFSSSSRPFSDRGCMCPRASVLSGSSSSPCLSCSIEDSSSFSSCTSKRSHERKEARSFSSSVPPGTPEFVYKKVFDSPTTIDVPYKRIDDLSNMIKMIDVPDWDKPLLYVSGDLISSLTKRAFEDISFYLRSSHLASLRRIFDDPEASENDRFVALTLLKNANIAAGRVYPGCQDTGTAIVLGKKGSNVLTKGDDEKAIFKGVYDAYTRNNLRYSQVAPKDMFTEANTKTNLPAQVDILSSSSPEKSQCYELLFIAKGGGSANKTFFYQQTKALLNPTALYSFLEKNIKTIGTSACPPYHLAIVIGGLSAEQTLKTVKLASCRYLDGLPTHGDNVDCYAFRDLDWEEKVLKMTRELGIGAQFGGKYFCHDVRVVRLPRHGASCPLGIGVSCSADRQVLAKITPDGVFMEQLELNPARFLPDVDEEYLQKAGGKRKAVKEREEEEEGRKEEEERDEGEGESVKIDLNMPMKDILKELSKYKTATRLSLTGTMVVARDIAHAKLLERLETEGDLPDYIKKHPIYYAGPAKTPEGCVSGSFGPTTAGRMDVYVDRFMQKGGSMITLAKGNRSKAVLNACKKYGGFYLGSIGGPAAILGRDCIKKVEVLEYPELGMEAIWKIEVQDFPAFIVMDDKGHDLYSKWLG